MASPGYHGLLVLDKPLGVTSRDAVDRAQHWFPRGTRIGHTGTLDPLATGALVLCVGHATRLTEYVQNMDKVYVAEVRLGGRSITDDAEGPTSTVAVERPPSRGELNIVLPSFIGQVRQVPPAYSAAKLAGRRAYALARQGQEPELAPRTVRIDRIDVLDFDYPNLRLEVRCGKGTYIRSLARDLGDELGCGAYLTGLRRTSVGSFTPADAVPADADAATARARLKPLAAAVTELPWLTLPAAAVNCLRQGQRVALEPTRAQRAIPPHTELAALDEAGHLVAVVATDAAGTVLRPVKVMPV
jgi:tRNA pseudouridine55 synthase